MYTISQLNIDTLLQQIQSELRLKFNKKNLKSLQTLTGKQIINYLERN